MQSKESFLFLIELRTRLIYSAIFLLSLFSICLFFANQLYSLLAHPLLKFLPQGHLIATQLMSPFYVPFKLAFMAAILLSVPFFLYQIWTYISPALYGHERRLIWPGLLISTVLFYTGIAFAYLLIFPALFHFLANTAPPGVLLSPDINDYLDLTMKLLLTFGGLFEIPILMMLLIAFNLISRQRFTEMRGYAIVGAFIIGMLLAPPDIVSQTILAVPIWLLYEIGILLSFLIRSN